MIDDELVIVRGINDKFIIDNLVNFDVYFGGAPQATPANHARFIGFYIGNSDQKVSHVGIVNRISEDRNTWHLSAIFELKHPVSVDHSLRKHECWRIDRFHKVDVCRMLALYEVLN